MDKERLDILIVEDSATQASQLQYLLEKHGYRVRSASNGRAALRALRDARPALVVSDIVMPEMDGYELCRQIRAVPATAELPVLLVTTLADPNDVLAGLTCGADSFIKKPYDEKYLLSHIRFCLANIEMRTHERMQVGLEIMLHGERQFISAARQQILNMLISTYEQAVGLNAALTQANNDLESFTSSVSHDLRSPLSAVLGFADVLQMQYSDRLDAQGQEYLQYIIDGCTHMQRLINDLLRFSRLGRQALDCASTDMNELVARSCLELAFAGQDCQPITCEPLPSAWCDPDLLQQVWTNLLANALKYSAKKTSPQIQVSGWRAEAECIYKVSDNGAGFAMENYAKLFGMFQRLHAEKDFAGNGVGLSLCQRIIQRHGGRIWAESEPEQGASFYFSLPERGD